MADRSAELAASKAAASNYGSQLKAAGTKDEALTLAISAAESLMKAMRLTSDRDEKMALKAQCGDMMSTADRIKKSADWEMVIKESASPYSNPAIDQAAAGVPTSANSVAAQALQSLPWSAPYGLSLASNGASMISDDVARAGQQEQGPRVSPNADIDYRPAHDPTFQRSNPTGLLASSSPSTAPHSHVHRLAEPLSTRKRSTKEDIILLKASMVNGFKCPPWKENPSSSEFELQAGVEPFVDIRDLSLSPYQRQFFQAWVRAELAVPPPSMVSTDDRNGPGPLMSGSKSIDLVQDAATDCSVVTSLCAAIARAERGHAQMLSNKLYPYDKQLGKPVISSNGKYIVRLNFNGVWRKVVIDDRLPVSTSHRLLHVIDRRNPALLWPALLEKAYLKVRGGYDFPGSNSCSDLWTLTGWIPEQVFLQETDTVPDQLWNRVYNAFSYGDVLVTAGTGKMSTRQERELGLEGQHSYVVLDMKKTEHDRMLLVKNPWVEGKGWRGPRPSAVSAMDSTASTESSKNSLDTYHTDSIPTKDRPHPTTFWIGLEQVIRHFESLYLNWNPGLFRYRQDIHFEWLLESKSAGGCIVQHPQFTFTSKGAGPAWLLLNRHFRDIPAETKEESDAFNDGSIRFDSQVNSSGESPKGYMSIYVCTNDGEQLYIKDTYLESSDYVTTPQCLLRFDTAVNTAYTVVIDQDELPLSRYTFSLSAFSNTPITLESAMSKYPLQKTVQGSWSRQTAGGSTSSAKYFENPQYSLKVHQHGSLAILLTSSTHEHPLHVKLALGHGKRLYRLQSRDVLVDSGNHRDGCVFAEIQGLQPGLYTIICSLFEAGQTGDYTLRIDSTSEIDLKPIPRDGAGLLSKKMTPACFGADIHKIAAPLLPHRLASYTIVARFLRATSSRSMELGNLARSPLRFSVEVGRGPERKFLIASEEGEYSDSAIVRSESVNIDPAVRAQGELYIVLDRLSGPGGPIEEWYEVEIFTDMPNAFQVGVWRDWSD